MLEERNQLPRRERQCPVDLFHPRFIVHIILLVTVSKHNVLSPVRQWTQVATNRTGPQNNQLSVQHANHVAFNQLSQRTYERAVTEGVPNKSLRDIILDAFWRSVQSRGQRHFVDPERVLNHKPVKRYLIVSETFQHWRPRLYGVKHPALSHFSLVEHPSGLWLSSQL